MTESNLRTVGPYASAPKAHLAKAFLGENGIQSAVVGDQIAEALGYLGVTISKIELLVHQAHVDEARRLLSEWEQESRLRNQDRWGVESRMGWRCADCKETNQQNFDECWSCSAVRQSDAALVPLPDDLESNVDPPDLITAAENPDPSPFRAPKIENRPPVPAERIDRAFRSAVLGVGFPPLAVYSFGLALRCLSEGRPVPKVWVAIFLSATTVFLWLVFFFLAGLHEVVLQF